MNRDKMITSIKYILQEEFNLILTDVELNIPIGEICPHLDYLSHFMVFEQQLSTMLGEDISLVDSINTSYHTFEDVLYFLIEEYNSNFATR